MAKGNRHASYAKKVAEFIAANGPAFKLAQVVNNSTTALDCQCCGYKNIVNHYHVVGEAKGERFIIGSECQELVLGFADAHMPAARVRMLDRTQLELLAAKYNAMVIPSMTNSEAAEFVIKARRSLANTQGWVERRRQGKAPAAATTAVA